ncbi:hypothetical protein CoNPh26_CDS0045 [Staphylococcus phage S-CoN_Ph26]|nr:hypothetical protein CoNPh26_CDS0045 [Staphylococcus phage S-CoN_Ph26]
MHYCFFSRFIIPILAQNVNPCSNLGLSKSVVYMSNCLNYF